MADMRNTEVRNSFIANVNLLVRQLKLLVELNTKFSKTDVEALTKLSSFIDSLMILVENIDLLDEIHAELPEIHGLWKVVEELPAIIEQMRNEINAALMQWEGIEQDILPQLQALKGVFTSVNIWTIDTSSEIAVGTYVKIPPYSYNYANIIIMLNGVSTREFTTIAPINANSPNSKYIKFNEAIPKDTQIIGVTFTSPEVTVIPEVVIHDATLVGDGTTISPLKIHSDIVNSVTTNSNNIAVVQTDILNIHNDINSINTTLTENGTSVSSLTTKINLLKENTTSLTNQTSQNTSSLSTLTSKVGVLEEDSLEIKEDIITLRNTVENLPTTEDLTEAIAAATPEQTYASDVTLTTSMSSSSLTVATLSNKGVVGTKTHPVPIASSTNAGMLPASLYTQIILLQAQIDGLTGSSITIINDTVLADATQTQLNDAWVTSGETLTNGATIENNSLGLRWIYRNSLWYGPYTFTQATIASINQLGVVKSVEALEGNAGQIFVEQDGSMSLLGYDSIVADVLDTTTRISVIENDLNTLTSTTEDLTSSLNTLTTTVNNTETTVATNSVDIAALKVTLDSVNASVSSISSNISTIETNVATISDKVNVIEANIASINSAIANIKVKEWNTSILVPLPYISGTVITVPSYIKNRQSLDVFINGVKTDSFTELTTTTISLNEGIVGSGTVQLMINCYKV